MATADTTGIEEILRLMAALPPEEQTALSGILKLGNQQAPGALGGQSAPATQATLPSQQLPGQPSPQLLPGGRNAIGPLGQNLPQPNSTGRIPGVDSFAPSGAGFVAFQGGSPFPTDARPEIIRNSLIGAVRFADILARARNKPASEGQQ